MEDETSRRTTVLSLPTARVSDMRDCSVCRSMVGCSSVSVALPRCARLRRGRDKRRAGAGCRACSPRNALSARRHAPAATGSSGDCCSTNTPEQLPVVRPGPLQTESPARLGFCGGLGARAVEIPRFLARHPAMASSLCFAANPVPAASFLCCLATRSMIRTVTLVSRTIS